VPEKNSRKIKKIMVGGGLLQTRVSGGHRRAQTKLKTITFAARSNRKGFCFQHFTHG
jgi:hypothetical protein